VGYAVEQYTLWHRATIKEASYEEVYHIYWSYEHKTRLMQAIANDGHAEVRYYGSIGGGLDDI